MKNGLAVSLALVALTLGGCAAATPASHVDVQPAPVTAPPAPVATTAAQPVIGKDVPDGVAQFLVKTWKAALDQNLSASQSDGLRLKDWRLESITRQDDIYLVSFAVLPAVPQSDWLAGSGVPGKDGWILHKVKPSRVIEKNGAYELGTPPW